MEPFDGVFPVIGLIEFVIVIIALAATLFWLWALIDCLQRDFREPIYKLVWVLVILFLHFLGAILYLAIGRAQGERR